MIFFKKSICWLTTSAVFLFLLLLLTLKIIKIPHVYSVNGQTIFISDTKYDNNGYFAYVLDLKKEEFLKFNTFNQITIFFSLDKSYLTIFFPKWNDNDQLLIDKNISSNTYLNQRVIIVLGEESLLAFIWNNITT